MPSELVDVHLGRFGAVATWILFALASGPRRVTSLFDDVHRHDANVGPGALFGAVARLERLGLIEAVVNGDGRRAYRLTDQWPGPKVAHPEGSSR